MSIKTYYITHIITITQEIPAPSKAAAEKAYQETIINPEDFLALVDEDCTSTSSTNWEITVRSVDEQDKYEEEQNNA